MRQFTHLGRGVDLRLPSNAWWFAVSGTAGALALFVERDLFFAISIAGSAFLAWILARELDPDRPGTAGIVAVLAPALAWYAGRPSLLAVYALAVAARVVSRSTGLAPLRGDVLVHVLVGVAAAWNGVTAAAGVALGAAFLLDARALPDPAPAKQARLGAAIAGAAAVLGAIRLIELDWDVPHGYQWLLVTAAVVAAIIPVRGLRSTGDHTDTPLDPIRLEWARRLVAVALVVIVGAGGVAGAVAISPALVAAALSGWPRRAPS